MDKALEIKADAPVVRGLTAVAAVTLLAFGIRSAIRLIRR